MRRTPTDDEDRLELARLYAEPWMVEMLQANPEYVFWGPHEDYMCKPGPEEPRPEDQGSNDSRSHGWESRILAKDWAAFGPWELDELNECVNFYFEIARDNKPCPACGGTGYHPDARWVADSFHRHSSPFRYTTMPPANILARYGEPFESFCRTMSLQQAWYDMITQEEVDLLIAEGRIRQRDGEQITAEMVNRAQEAGLGSRTTRSTV